jgi:hypothetical protein
MRFYRLIFLIIFLILVVMIGVSCSERQEGGKGINIFRPDSSKVEQYNRNVKGTQRNEVGVMSKSMRDVRYEHTDDMLFGYLAAVIGFIALIVLALVFERYWTYRLKIVADSPAALFVELCAAHQLTRMERSLIERVAEAADVSDPLPIFIEPRYLQDATENSKFKEVKQIIEYLLTKLFESKSESSILKRSSILLKSELDSKIKNEPNPESDSNINDTTIINDSTIIADSKNINDSTVAYAPAQIQKNSHSHSPEHAGSKDK